MCAPAVVAFPVSLDPISAAGQCAGVWADGDGAVREAANLPLFGHQTQIPGAENCRKLTKGIKTRKVNGGEPRQFMEQQTKQQHRVKDQREFAQMRLQVVDAKKGVEHTRHGGTGGGGRWRGGQSLHLFGRFAFSVVKILENL